MTFFNFSIICSLFFLSPNGASFALAQDSTENILAFNEERSKGIQREITFNGVAVTDDLRKLLEEFSYSEEENEDLAQIMHYASPNQCYQQALVSSYKLYASLQDQMELDGLDAVLIGTKQLEQGEIVYYWRIFVKQPHTTVVNAPYELEMVKLKTADCQMLSINWDDNIM